MLIYFCASCLNYELRHSWEMSSLIEQYGDPMPDIFCDVATLAGTANRYRFPERMAEERSEHVRLRYFPTERETFAKRGLVRNEQIRRAIKARADWIFFGDCDRTYHPQFFSRLAKALKTPELRKTELAVTSILRICTELEATEKLMATEAPARYHPNAYFRSLQLPIAWRKRIRMATGGMQVVRPEVIVKKCGGYYADPKTCPDAHMFKRIQYARSDVVFRQTIGGSVALNLPGFVHLDHRRDKEAGHHLTEQR